MIHACGSFKTKFQSALIIAKHRHQKTTAPWIAFLDDDDEWLPRKIELQLAAAEGRPSPCIITTLVYATTPSGRYVWPLRIYDNIIPLDQYLFDRRSLTKGESYLHVSSLLVSRGLFECYKFPALRMYEDYSFLLEAVKCGKAEIITVLEPLSLLYTLKSAGPP